MELWDNAEDSITAGLKQFFKQKSDQHVYIFPLNIGKVTFFTVLSAGQTKKYKLKKQQAAWVIGDNETIREHKRTLKHVTNTQERDREAYKALQRYHQAKGKLDKLIDQHPEYSKIKEGIKGAESGKTPT